MNRVISRRLPVEQPGLHGGRVRDRADQVPAAEHEAGVGPQRGRPDVPGADLLADDTAGAVRPDHVLGGDRDRDPGRVEQGRVHWAVGDAAAYVTAARVTRPSHI